MEEAKKKENKPSEKTDEKDKDKEKGQQSSGKDKDKKEEQELVRWGYFPHSNVSYLNIHEQWMCYFALVTAAVTTWLSRPESLPLIDGCLTDSIT